MARNKQKAKISDKAYYEAHKKEKKAYDKAYHKKHKKRINVRRRAHHETHKKEAKAYRITNSEHHKAWRKTNINKLRDFNRKRHALKHTTQIESINEKTVYLRDGWKCQHCKKRVDKNLRWPNPLSPSLDHIVPLSQGGTHTYNNIQLAHLKCNLSKHNNVLPQGEQMRLF